MAKYHALFNPLACNGRGGETAKKLDAIYGNENMVYRDIRKIDTAKRRASLARKAANDEDRRCVAVMGHLVGINRTEIARVDHNGKDQKDQSNELNDAFIEREKVGNGNRGYRGRQENEEKGSCIFVFRHGANGKFTNHSGRSFLEGS